MIEELRLCRLPVASATRELCLSPGLISGQDSSDNNESKDDSNNSNNNDNNAAAAVAAADPDPRVAMMDKIKAHP